MTFLEGAAAKGVPPWAAISAGSKGRRAFDSGAENILNYTSMSVLAYVDPSVMSYTVQAIAGVAIALGVVFGVVWRRLKKGANKALGRDENAGKEIEDEIIRK